MGLSVGLRGDDCSFRLSLLSLQEIVDSVLLIITQAFSVDGSQLLDLPSEVVSPPVNPRCKA